MNTIKDLKTFVIHEGYVAVRVKDLEELFKWWIKELKKSEKMTLEFAAMYGIRPYQLEFLNKAWKAEKKFTIGWIKHISNLKEEDLI